MSYRGIGTSFDALSIGLRGDHQFFNASLALCTLEILAKRGFAIDERTIRTGPLDDPMARKTRTDRGNAGRPAVLLDGAHNPDGARTLAAFLATHFDDKKKILIFGVMKDKDFRGMLTELLPVVHHVILTKPEIARAALPADVAAYAPGADVTNSVRDAINRGIRGSR